MVFSAIKTFIKSLILTCIFTIQAGSIFGNSDLDSLRKEYLMAADDTTRIHLLFLMGNRFLDGPSDSLINYYQQALSRIESFLSQPYEKLDQIDKKTISTYKHFHFRALNEIGIEKFFLGQYNESLEYAFRALKIAEEIKNIGLISECCGAIGIVYKNQGKYPEALDYYQRALDLAIESQDTAWIAACYANAGNVYRRLGNFSKALDYLLKAYEVFERSNEQRRMAIGLMNIGNLYEDQNDDQKALEYYNKALTISYQTDDYKRIAECLINIGNIYSGWKQYPLARDFYDKSLAIHMEQGFMHTLDDCYRNIGKSFEMEGNFSKAIEYYKLALELGEKEDDKSTLSEVQGSLAAIYIRTNNLTKGLEHAELSLDIAKQTGDLQNLKNAYELLAKAYEGLNDKTAAFESFKQYAALKDSLFSTDKYRAIKEIEAKYELEKKENQLALLTEKNHVQQLTLSRRNRVLFTSLGIIILLIIIGYILIWNNRLKAKSQAIELEQKLLRSQMNPHFIFNSLMAIQSYIYKNDPVQAGDFLAKFADLIRITLENSRVEFVLLENEIKMLQIYLELQALRFNNKFDYSIQINDDVDIRTIKIPPMLAQPFIENAIEHGLRHKTAGGFIQVKYVKANKHLSFSVEDNGIGREKSWELETDRKHKAMATSITKERLGLLSKRFKQRFELHLVDLKDDNNLPVGTSVKFNLPYLKLD